MQVLQAISQALQRGDANGVKQGVAQLWQKVSI